MKFKKICAHCKQPFETNSPQKIYCNRDHYQPCPVCGTPVKMYDNDFSRKPPCCSNECRHKLRKQHFSPKTCILCGEIFIPNSGCQTACDKIHYDNCEICGKQFVRTVANKIDGVTTCSHECSQMKLKRKYLEKYGVEHPMQCQEVQDHFHDAMEQKYNKRHALQISEFKTKQESTNLKEFGTIHACLSENCQTNLPKSAVSKLNIQLQQALLNDGIESELEFQLNRYVYDMHIKDTKILLELNPTYTHNNIGNHWSDKGLDVYYHRNKTMWANENGYQCIHIWDWDNVNIVINQLGPRQSVDASEFQVYKLTNEVTDKFLTDNCIHGTCRGQLLSLGLVKNNEIYQVMTFGKSKRNKEYPIEMKRACTRIGYQIAGGYDKLSKAASQEFGIESCIAYQDISKLSDINYEELGMKLLTTNPPRKIWSKGKKYISDYLVQNPQTEYTEKQLLAYGWLPVYDCGQAVYVTQ